MQSSQPTPRFFGDNVFVNGGHFTQHNVQVQQQDGGKSKGGKDGFKILQKKVAPSAFHNSAQRVYQPKCHPNTREAVKDRIFDWVLAPGDQRQKIMWLNGAAGAGKSAIAQSIAEMCVSKHIDVLSFFFFRTDTRRNNIRPLVATLAYQLAILIPSTRRPIGQLIDINPLIFEQSLEVQLEALIIKPLLEVRSSGRLLTTWRLLCILDGLDECAGRNVQVDLLITFCNLLAKTELPILLLVGSRAESHITMVFNSAKFNNILFRLPLDNHYLPEEDIRRFLIDNFCTIKQTHPLRHLIDANWPSPSLVEEIVRKSSGQFIYGSVVMKFISSSHGHPPQQLEIVRGLRTSPNATPFDQLDTLYLHIFDQVQDLKAVMTIMAFIILGEDNTINVVSTFLRITRTDIHISMIDLPSVISCENGGIEFLHASLPDFLLDQSRSQKFHLSIPFWSNHLAHIWFRNAASHHVDLNTCSLIVNFLTNAMPTLDLREDVLRFDPSNTWGYGSRLFLSSYLSTVRNLTFEDGLYTYNNQLEIIARGVAKRYPEDLDYLRKAHNISHIYPDYHKYGRRSNSSQSWISRIMWKVKLYFV